MATFTRKMILLTFSEMLETTPLDKITVTALVKRCGISANTFYYHFHDISDLLEAWMSENLSFLSDTPLDQWNDEIKAFLLRCKANERLIRHITGSLLQESFERYLFRSSDDVFSRVVESYAAGKNVSEIRKQHLSEFCRYSFLGFLLHYIWSGMREDVDDLVNDLEPIYRTLLQASMQESRP